MLNSQRFVVVKSFWTIEFENIINRNLKKEKVDFIKINLLKQLTTVRFPKVID